jgi:hypothetical protein
VLKTACHDMPKKNRARIDHGIEIAQKLEYIEFYQHEDTKKVRLSQKGSDLIEQLKHKFQK